MANIGDNINDKSLDIATQITERFKEIAGLVRDINTGTREIGDSSLGWSELVEGVYHNSEKLSKQFFKVHNLQNNMNKSMGTLKKFQQEALKYIEKEHKQRLEEVKLEKEQDKKRLLATKDLLERKQLREKILEKERISNKLADEALKDQKELLKEEVKRTKEIIKYNEMQKASIGNISKGIDSLQEAIMNPAKSMKGFVDSIGDIPQKMLEAKKEGSSMFSVFVPGFVKSGTGAMKLAGVAGGSLVAAMVALGGAVAVVYKAFEGFVSLFKSYWDYLDKYVIPAQAEFNKQIGNNGKAAQQIKSQMQGMGDTFRGLGLSYEEGTAKVRDFTEAFGNLNNQTREATKIGVKLQAVYGLSGDEAGRLSMMFDKQTGSLEGLTEMTMRAKTEAEAYGVPVNDVIRDLGKYPNIMARFGVSNRKEFANAAAKARSYGLEIGKITSAFGETLDTFEGSAMAASKMNAIFGTSVNTFELMMETDPTKRMEMLRKEIVKGNRSWETMNVFEKNTLKTMLGIDDETAALTFANDKQRKSLEALAKKKKEQQKTDEKWNDSLSSIKNTLLPLGFLFEKLTRQMSKFLFETLGIKDVNKDMTRLGTAVEKFFNNLFGVFDDPKTKKSVTDITGSFNQFIEKLNSKEFAESVGVALKQIPTFIATVVGPALQKLPDILDILETVVLKIASLPLIGSEEAGKMLEAKKAEKAIAPLKTLLENAEVMKSRLGSGDLGKQQSLMIETLKTRIENEKKAGLGGITEALTTFTEWQTKIYKQQNELLKQEQENQIFKNITEKSVQDALITKHGQIVKFDPNDNIFASKNPGMNQRSVAGKTTSNSSPEDNIFHVHIHLDGREIGSSLVRASRK